MHGIAHRTRQHIQQRLIIAYSLSMVFRIFIIYVLGPNLFRMLRFDCLSGFPQPPCLGFLQVRREFGQRRPWGPVLHIRGAGSPQKGLIPWRVWSYESSLEFLEIREYSGRKYLGCPLRTWIIRWKNMNHLTEEHRIASWKVYFLIYTNPLIEAHQDCFVFAGYFEYFQKSLPIMFEIFLCFVWTFKSTKYKVSWERWGQNQRFLGSVASLRNSHKHEYQGFEAPGG